MRSFLLLHALTLGALLGCAAPADPEPSFVENEPTTLIAMPTIADAINATCPFSGDPIQPDSLTTYEGLVIGFCNPHCRDDFAADPAAYMDRVGPPIERARGAADDPAADDPR